MILLGNSIFGIQAGTHNRAFDTHCVVRFISAGHIASYWCTGTRFRYPGREIIQACSLTVTEITLNTISGSSAAVKQLGDKPRCFTVLGRYRTQQATVIPLDRLRKESAGIDTTVGAPTSSR